MTSVRTRARWDGERLEAPNSVKVELRGRGRGRGRGRTDEEYSFWALLRDVYPTFPLDPFPFFGMLVCVINGAMTLIFSFLFSRLLFEVSIDATNVPILPTLDYTETKSNTVFILSSTIMFIYIHSRVLVRFKAGREGTVGAVFFACLIAAGNL
jgi:hypothetical protein